jgi:uncharacterized membrane protein
MREYLSHFLGIAIGTNTQRRQISAPMRHKGRCGAGVLLVMRGYSGGLAPGYGRIMRPRTHSGDMKNY